MIGAARGAQGRSYQLLATNQFTTGGTQSYSIPAGTSYLSVELWGGGGGGAGGKSTGNRPTNYYGGGGGGGGGYARYTMYGGQPNTGTFLGCAFNNFDMQAGDLLVLSVGAPGRGGAAGVDGVAGLPTSIIKHTRNGITVLDHDSLTAGGEFNVCSSSLFYSVLANGGYGGLTATIVPNGGTAGLITQIVIIPDRRELGSEEGFRGQGNNGTSTASGGGTGGKAGGFTSYAGGNGGTGGAAGAIGMTGGFPGGGGGGGGSNSTTQARGGTGAVGSIIIKAYG